MLFVGREDIYRHLANIRKKIGAKNTLEILYLLEKKHDTLLANMKLTPRGKKVFLLTLQGYSDKEIGFYLGMSYSGVRRHKEKMLLANDTNNMLELISKYYA